MREIWPLVPLAADHSVGVAILSYDGRLFFGLVADRDVDDLDVLAGGVRASLDELAALARPRSSPRAGARAVSSPPAAAAPALDTERLDAVVDRAQAAARAFRKLDQEQVDRIVWEMTVAGLRAAIELAELAMEETGFGVFEDKVVKNYVATEFLYDYLKDKRSVGRHRGRSPSAASRPSPSRSASCSALLPITNPTSTALFKSIVAAKTRNAIVFRPSARAARCAARAIELLQEAGERAGLPPDALQVVPDPTLDVSQYLFHHPGVDFIWTTGGPKAVAAANAAGKPCISRRPRQRTGLRAPQRRRARWRSTDILISKTFDASVICPAEQTCVVDEAIADELVAEFERLGARVLDDEESPRSPAVPSTRTATSSSPRSASPASNLAGLAGFDAPRRRQGAARAAARRPRRARAPPARCRRSSCPCSGWCARRRVEHAHRGLRAHHRARRAGPHLGCLCEATRTSIARFSDAVRTGRILVNAPTAVGALGGIYNSMTPTFSLGCGTWGGSTTTDNVNYRNLLNLKTVSRRQAPAQWFRVPVGHLLQRRRAREPRDRARRPRARRDRRPDRGRGAVDEVRAHLDAALDPCPRATSARARRGPGTSRGRGARALRPRPDRRRSAEDRRSTRPRRCGCSGSTRSSRSTS